MSSFSSGVAISRTKVDRGFHRQNARVESDTWILSELRSPAVIANGQGEGAGAGVGAGVGAAEEPDGDDNDRSLDGSDSGVRFSGFSGFSGFSEGSDAVLTAAGTSLVGTSTHTCGTTLFVFSHLAQA